MSARELYDKHARALKAAERGTWRGGFERIFPAEVPVAYDFLSADEKTYWNDFAKLLTPRRR